MLNHMWLRETWWITPTSQEGFQTKWLQCKRHFLSLWPHTDVTSYWAKPTEAAAVPHIQAISDSQQASGKAQCKNCTHYIKNAHPLRLVEDDLGLKVPGTHSIQHEYFKMYAGEISCTTETRCKKHAKHICLHQWDKLVMTEHKAEKGHHINFKDTILLAECWDTRKTMRSNIRLTINISFLLSTWKIKNRHSFSNLVFHSFHY
jgi:hypothetical protein